MITPAFGPVADATADVAAANIAAFAADVHTNATERGIALGYTPQVGEPQRDPDHDADGRFAWTITVNGATVRVLMPGVDAAVLRHVTSGQRVGGYLPSDVPALRVGDSWAWWTTAAMWAAPLPARP
ncbi:hypothetical protein [Actinoplanes sp. G11-F43]|uniref:hypothetical protein n=1 Tax=Actinoplanes sp. G11-F43 TaxID=3424130 RepID=UPI003D336D15